MGSDYDCEQIKAMLAPLDVPPRQVMFEAEVVELSRSDLKNIGVNWGTQTNLPDALPTDPNSYFRIGLGIPNHPEYGTNLKVTINRLIENKKGRLLASPRITVLDGQTAQILIGDKLAVESRQAVSVGEPIISVQYIDVGIKLEVTPTINEDSTITTHIKPEVSNKTDSTEHGNPNIRTRQADTTLRVKSGETIVLGGLIQREETHDTFKFPFLGDLPLVGQLFRSNSTEVRETELVIVITPKLVDQ
jgi:type II secretory pathway component GspD/PulD (secretin)